MPAKAKFQGFTKRDMIVPGEDLLANIAPPTDADASDAPPREPVSIFQETGGAIEDLPINGRLKEGLALQGFSKLTRVQHAAFQPILGEDSRDVLIKSSTGSGKTIAYLLPLLERILNYTAANRIGRDHGTIGMILVPTRELAEQCYAVLQKTLRKTPFIVSGCITGGEQRSKEKARLRQGVHFLVATVGRLLDHLRTTQSFKLTNLKYMIFDEADRLLDMGYEDDIRTIKQMLSNWGIHPEKSILVSATLGEGIKRLSHYVLRDPHMIGEGLDSAEKAAQGQDAEAGGEAPETTPVEGEAAGAAAGRGNKKLEGDMSLLDDTNLEVPPTLTQLYVAVPTKLRLVCLVSLLRWKLAESTVPHVIAETATYKGVRDNVAYVKDVGAKRKRDGGGVTEAAAAAAADPSAVGIKIIVFVNSADTVEFLYRLVSSLKIRSADRHAFRKDRDLSKQDIAERRKEAKKRKGEQKKKEREANAHLDWDDEDGFVNFESGDEEEGGRVGGGFGGVNFGDDYEEGANINNDERGWEAFISTNLFKLHGSMSQIDRVSIFESFRRCANGILFATDVAARGLDLPGVRYVIQYDPALDIKSYTHRIGRTARAGRPGDSILFVQPPAEMEYVKHLVDHAKWVIKPMTTELILFHLSKVFKGTHLLECSSELHQYCEKATTEDPELRRLSGIAFQAYTRAYSAYPKEVVHIFNLKNLHLGHVAKSFAIMRNPTNLRDLTRESQHATYEPTLVRKAKDAERFRDGGDGMTRNEAAAAAAKKAFRKPKATSRVGQFDEFASGDFMPAPASSKKPRRK